MKLRRVGQDSDIAEFYQESQKQESEKLGIEYEKDDDSGEENWPYDVKSIRIDQKMISVFQVEYWISSGRLNLKPEYQRYVVWDFQRKCALVESLLLRIPIPAFYIEENKDGSKSVIDGMQRLTTIHEFLNNEFPLQKMQYLKNCEGLYFRDLNIKFRSAIEDTQLAVNLLDERCPQMVKFDVFRRVNTGGVPLNPQEIRNIMMTGRVRAFLREMSGSAQFQKATLGKVKDTRMGAQELCLRFLAIYLNYDWKLKEFTSFCGLLGTMDYMVVQLNEVSDEKLEELKERFFKVMEECALILGKQSFCKPGSRTMNKALFTGWAVTLCNLSISDGRLKECRGQLFQAYMERLSHDEAFYDSISVSTGTRKNIQKSIESIREVVEGIL
ncbi:MAG: DUF262 domain-containing protein [Eubacteriales bacterium]|nr:DUF262 domain-containing protein [Eubacteriales bacterium]